MKNYTKYQKHSCQFPLTIILIVQVLNDDHTYQSYGREFTIHKYKDWILFWTSDGSYNPRCPPQTLGMEGYTWFLVMQHLSFHNLRTPVKKEKKVSESLDITLSFNITNKGGQKYLTPFKNFQKLKFALHAADVIIGLSK